MLWRRVAEAAGAPEGGGGWRRAAEVEGGIITYQNIVRRRKNVLLKTKRTSARSVNRVLVGVTSC